MTYLIYDYINSHGQNEFKEWTSKQEKKQRAKLDEKIDKLALYGDGLYPHTLTGTAISGIQKLRIQGNVKLRPLLCHGPINVKTEYTFLMGAKEVGNKWEPKNAPSIANVKKEQVVQDPGHRRTKHGTFL